MSPSRSGAPRRAYRRVVLLGFMASGKSTVGRELAAELGWEYIDLDREIERAAGRTIEEIFARDGEAAFRRLEVEMTPRYLERDEVVLAPGGGWVTNPGLLESLPADTLSVWLRVSADEVLRRVTTSRTRTVRPLLQTPDPRRRIVELMAAREPLYRRATIAVDGDRSNVKEIVRTLAAAVHTGTAGGRAEPV